MDETTAISKSFKNVKEDFSRLNDLCYLDYTGSALYSDSQIDAVTLDLKSCLYTNPHSLSTTSRFTLDNIDQIRYRILGFFNTTADEYSVIFTSGATEALKLTTEWFNWENNDAAESNPDYEYNGSLGDFVYMQDNHTSVLGLREIVKDRNVNSYCLTHENGFQKFNKNGTKSARKKDSVYNGNSLFVYSPQCNFSGIKYPLEWIDKVHNGVLDDVRDDGLNKPTRWFCLLDAATFVSTNKLDMDKYKPDFVAVSFYKIFGYPTGLGALLVKNSSACVLSKRYYGGGTVLMVLSNVSFHIKRPVLHEKCEDGTINYLSILALRHGFDALDNLAGSMDDISEHVFKLTKYTHDYLLKLRHSNEKAAVKIYRDTDYSEIKHQGGIINFNILRNNGDYVSYLEVLQMANLHNIQLRTGCFCNPGACQRHLQLTNDQLRTNYSVGHTCVHNIDLISGYPTGSVRVSFGYTSDMEDANKLIKMLIDCFVSKPVVLKIPDDWPKVKSQLKSKFTSINEKELLSDVRNGENNNSIIIANGYHTAVQETRTISHTVVDSAMDIKLTNIFIYPIKSCGYHKVTSDWRLVNSGLQYDRQWMIVTKNRVMLNQLQKSKMCLIKPYIDLQRNMMMLSFPGVSTTVSIPLQEKEMSRVESNTTDVCHSKVCGDRAKGIDCGHEVSDWLSVVLNTEGLRLIRVFSRDNKSADENSTLTFVNKSQILLINENTVNWLIERLGGKSNSSLNLSLENMIDRFRANLTIAGNATALSELEWTKVQIGPYFLKVDEPCNRCRMICIDQSSGEKNNEPLTELTAALQGKMKFGIYLSVNAANDALQNSTIKIGSPVTPLLQ